MKCAQYQWDEEFLEARDDEGGRGCARELPAGTDAGSAHPRPAELDQRVQATLIRFFQFSRRAVRRAASAATTATVGRAAALVCSRRGSFSW